MSGEELQRKRERERERKRERERVRESQTGSTFSMEPDAGLKLMNREIMTRAEIKSQMLSYQAT